MNQKLSILMVLFAFLFSGSAFAQSVKGDAAQPYAGSIHSYWVDSNDGTALSGTDHNGSTYQWWVTKGDLITINYNNELSLLNSDGKASYSPTGTNPNPFSIKINWNSTAVAANTTYYLHVLETNNGCSNQKVIAITPVNNFILAMNNFDVSNKADNTGSNDQLSICPADVKPTLDVTTKTIEYDYGSNALVYKITAQNISSDATWSFKYKITQTSATKTPAAVTATWASTFADAISGGTSLTADEQQIPIGNQIIYVAIKINNSQLDISEGLSAQDYKFTLIGGSDSANNAASLYDGYPNPIKPTNLITGPLDKVQTVKARPATSSPISHD